MGGGTNRPEADRERRTGGGGGGVRESLRGGEKLLYLAK